MGSPKGVKRSEAYKENLRRIRTGWKFSDTTKKKISEKLKGNKNGIYGKGTGRSDTTRKNISEALKRQYKNGRKPNFKGEKRIEWSKKYRGLNHWNWRGGISFEPYGLEFNEDLKEVIRNRDRRKCIICGITELENKLKLAIHHIDYDKENNNPNNLISVCRKCHGKTNFNRSYWINKLKIN